MWQLAASLWHQLSAAEVREWEAAGTIRGMTGFAWYMSQALRPNPGIYLPLAGGTMTGYIDMSGHQVGGMPAPLAATHAARKAYVDAKFDHRSLFVWNDTFDNVLDYDGNDPAIGWTTIDLNAIVGNDALMAILQFRFRANVCGTAGSNHLALRTELGDPAQYIAVILHNEHDPSDKRGMAIIGLTDSQTFQYTIGEATAASGFAIDLWVQAWIE